MAPSILKNFREQPEHKYLYCDTCNSTLACVWIVLCAM